MSLSGSILQILEGSKKNRAEKPTVGFLFLGASGNMICMNIEKIQEMRAMVAIVGTQVAAANASACASSTLPLIRLQSGLDPTKSHLIPPNPT